MTTGGTGVARGRRRRRRRVHPGRRVGRPGSWLRRGSNPGRRRQAVPGRSGRSELTYAARTCNTASAPPSFPTFSVPVMRRFISDPPTPNPVTARTRPAGPPGPGQETFGVAQAEARRHGPEPRASGSTPLGARAKPGSRHPGRSPRRRFACDLRPPSPWRPEVLGSSTRSGTSALRLEPPREPRTRASGIPAVASPGIRRAGSRPSRSTREWRCGPRQASARSS